VSPPLDKRGFAVFFTGLSGSGKTTITSALIEALQSLLPTRRMTILDGDVVRTHLSRELGFSIKDRNTNVARMGWVAAEVVRHGGIAICSTISPFHESREESRQYVEETSGGFILVHVSTSVDECAARDVKGLYQKAKQGLVTLTGVSHPYEYPDKAELTIDAGTVPVESSVDFIIGSWHHLQLSSLRFDCIACSNATKHVCDFFWLRLFVIGHAQST
jgi:sulfate adenylyltransferase